MPPTASATGVLLGQRLHLRRVRARIDPDGNIASYDWTFGDGTLHGCAATMSHAYPTGGTYTGTLTVTDNRGAHGVDRP